MINTIRYNIQVAYVKGVFHLYGALVLAQVAAFLANIYLARLLGPANMGHIGVINVVLQFGIVIAGFGLNTAVMKFVSEPVSLEEKRKILFHAIVLTGVSSVAALVLFEAFLSIPGALNDSVAQSWLRLLVLILPVAALFRAGTSYYHGLKRIKAKAICESGYSVLSSFLSAGLATVLSLPGYVLGRFLAPLLAAGTLTTAIRQEVQPCRLEQPAVFSLLRFGGFSFLNNSFNLVVTTADIMVLSYILGDPTLVGYYTVAVMLVLGLRMIPYSIMEVTVPHLSERSADFPSVQRLVNTILRRLAPLMAVICGVSILLSTILISFAFGLRYVQAAAPFQVLAIGLFFWSVGNVYGYANLGLGKVHYNLCTAVTAGTVNVVLNVFLIWRFGMIGAAYATACSHVLRFLMNRAFFLSQQSRETAAS